MALISRLGARRGAVDARVWDALIAVGLLAVMTVELARREPLAGQGASSVVAYLLAVLLALPYAMHRRPVPAVMLCLSALLVYGAGRYVAFPGYPVFALVFGVALHTGRRAGAVTAAVSAAALAVAVAVQPAGVGGSGTLISTTLATVLAWALGENLRMRRARWAALEERARRLESEREERDRQAVLDERLRIARDLHDVIAHSMSVIAVEAGVAHHVVDSRPDLARQTLASVERASRAALIEMRRLMGVLRQPDAEAGSLAPAPGLDDVPVLVRRLADTGLEVEVQVEGRPRSLPAGTDLSAYRIVQEALTNVLRHGGPRAEVRLTYGDARLGVQVTDPGRATPSGNLLRGNGNGVRTDGSGSGAGAGHGLVGMRERVALFGGTLDAGPRPDGGFAVHAEIPIPEQAPDRVGPFGKGP